MAEPPNADAWPAHVGAAAESAVASARFRPRGKDVSRIEAFFDAAFAFAVTLMVVSLQVPATYDELVDTLRGVPAFAVCFLLLFQIWLAHYTFCRRYGLADMTCIVLNCGLVFLLLVYIFPLKFLCLLTIEVLTGFGPRSSVPFYQRCPTDKLDNIFIIYGLGFALVWLLVAGLYWHAYRRRGELRLDAVETCDTLESVTRFLGLALVGLISCLLAAVFAGGRMVVIAGWAYALIGVIEFFVGWTFGRRRDRIRRAPIGATNAEAAVAPS
ncbi:hypothetical protein RAS1_02720 [Phycisphaerae bacterium RAS1]|nr:hypothetical protein RAS1_02720 [Phycisphaerae bacterium RAS1]